MVTVGEMASRVAHEIKNPLAIIVQGIEFIKSSLSDSSLADGLKRIKKAAEHADKIVRALLDLSHQERLVLRPINVCGVIEEVLSFMKYQIDAERVQIKKAFAPDLPKIKAGRGQLQQLFLNLFFNAIEAMSGEGTVYIGVDKAEPFEGREYVRIMIQDDGCGIPEEELARVFDPFYSTKVDKKSAGLGLAVSKSIVEMHLGTIEVESRLDKGTTVIIKLPVDGEGF